MNALHALLERKLDELPDAFRTVFVLRCVEECFKVYDEVETKAKEDTLTEYKAAVRKHLAESKESGVVVPSAATAVQESSRIRICQAPWLGWRRM